MKSTTTTLDPVRIIETIDRLRLRIESRFPRSGLLGVCGICLKIAEQARERAEFIDRPTYWLRAIIILFIVAIVFGVVSVTVFLPRHLLDITENWETIEALTSETLLLAAGLFFLISLETRFKRRRALSAIHELRALAHVVDMHQLTKDPERLLPDWIQSEHSPSMTMNAFELGRYLDYCNEMLSLIGKLAAVYIQRFDDEVALEAVTEVEILTASLCDRIWQKIMFLNSIEAQMRQSDIASSESKLSSSMATKVIQAPKDGNSPQTIKPDPPMKPSSIDDGGS
jgi:hypothetical protein